MSQPSERVVRQELVDAIRMLEQAEYMNHSGHGSVRRDEASFYINSGSSVRGSLTVDDILVVDLDGRPLDGSTSWPPLEFPIHAEVYRARPDVRAVMHTHPQWSTYLTTAGVAPQVVYAQASVLGDMPVFDTPASINSRAMGERMARELGDQPVILLKAHGGVVAGDSVLEAFTFAAYVEENARRQYMSLQIGPPYVFDTAEREAYATRLRSATLYGKTWDYYHGKLR